jgi:hypothetical protein
MSHHQTAGQYHNIKVGNKSLENVVKLKYVGMILTNFDCTQKEIRSRLNSGNACYHGVQDIFISCLLFNIILPVVLYRCENLVSHIKETTQSKGENRALRT